MYANSAQALVKWLLTEDAHIVGNAMAAVNGRAAYAMDGAFSAGQSIAQVKWKNQILEVKDVWTIDVLVWVS